MVYEIPQSCEINILFGKLSKCFYHNNVCTYIVNNLIIISKLSTAVLYPMDLMVEGVVCIMVIVDL